MSRNPQMDARAQEILKRNDRCGYTVPTHGFYPFQWSRGSAFVALGFARLIKKSGFYGRFSLETGEGWGGPDFSWTAAMWPAWRGICDGPARHGGA